jgi:hypothetical protein
VSLRQQIKELRTGAADLGKFGLLVGGVATLVSLLLLLRHNASYPYWLWPGLILIALGAISPAALKYPYIAWMTVAFVLGFVMAQVILTLLFFLLVTPIGLVARLFGKDFLNRKWDKEATTYWIRCKANAKTPASYEQQF